MGEMMRTVFDAAMELMGAAYRMGMEDGTLGRQSRRAAMDSPAESTAYAEGYDRGMAMHAKLLVAAKAAREAAEQGAVVVDGRLEVLA